ncbi:OmpW/AlkL family protein [Mucilaginibacter pedocola]|uniref:OmpW family protein n=1 Tax=Mucilaginibacter pedocola TaxID=1792845 RepID=A0A1S9PGS8_9SPHI|nr:OmpW family outer membrane protein [Mucilaginibacter pedocola]OOQ60165.1 OmpW family protein [Mucilaginibacter pedocola]
MKNLKLYLLALAMFSGLATFAQQKNEWDIRVRAVAVIPQENATIGVIGGGVNINNTVIPELDFTYYFANNFSAELILGTTKHKVHTTASNLTPIGGPAAADVDLGSVWLLPPTLTLQYHLPTGTSFKPYAGAGINYTIFYSANKGAVVQGIKYQNKAAFAAQAGFDYDITKKVFLNVDVKKVFLKTNVKVDAANLTPASNPGLGSKLQNIPADVNIKPWLIGVGVGFRL